MIIFKRINFWIKAARSYSFPMSVMSWSIPFLFGAKNGGNILFGLIALVGIVFTHAGVNLFDDFIDFNIEKSRCYDLADINLQKGKCWYLLNGEASQFQLLIAISVCFALAVSCGIFLAYKTGIFVLYIALAGAVISLLYPLLSFVALGEIAVAVMFAPLLYIGVFYVMTQSFSSELLPIAFSTGLLTVGLLHAHMFLDFDIDIPNKKFTLCRLAGSKINAARNQLFIMLLAYFNILFNVFINNLSKIYLITFFSLPTAVILFKVMSDTIKSDDLKIHTNIFFGILENLKEYEQAGNLNFMIIFMTARNVMVEFTILVCIAKIFSEYI